MRAFYESPTESFPRMWDQLVLRNRDGRKFRIIPTYVGSTLNKLDETNRISNHSHVCGINALREDELGFPVESFPRMWDQPPDEFPGEREARIIPTYVGSTARRKSTRRSRTNHSHVCGINASIGDLMMQLDESFPRMWDQPRLLSYSLATPRIIPTYVGSTGKSISVETAAANHSHVCGINAFALQCRRYLHESFPRMWDQRADAILLDRIFRIIPTYVGSTSPTS